MHTQPQSIVLTAIFLCVGASFCISPRVGFGQPDRNDPYALEAIFADQHLVDSAMGVHQRAMSMDAEERYEFLSTWVLPGSEHHSLRMQFDLEPTNPPKLNNGGQTPLDQRSVKQRARMRIGGGIISPVLDLLHVAEQLEKLDEVRGRVLDWEPQAEPVGVGRKEAMLILVYLADGKQDIAAEWLARFLEVAASDVSADVAPSDAEFLVYDRCLDVPRFREPVADALQRYQPWITSTYQRSPRKLLMASMLGRARSYHRKLLNEEATPVAIEPMAQWFPVSRSTAATRGQGHPSPRWDHRPGYVENMASHDEDYLYFALPLRGNYEVECDVSGFGWQDSHLMVAGTWVAPVYTRSGYDIGTFRTTFPRVEFSPPLTKVKDWIHYRTVVRDDTASTYFNGRKVHEQTLTSDHDPWLAIRSSPQHDGAVRNLRITGSPIVPESIRMSMDQHLQGWLPYYEDMEDVAGGGVAWRHIGHGELGGEIRGSTAVAKPLPAGESEAMGHWENLLRYHRPMLEDGTIEYEFYYVPGAMEVHPALDRLALLLHPTAVRVHWITDGRYERTGLSPSNVWDEPGNRRGGEMLPLEPNAWNRCQVRLEGDLLSLALNGNLVYERPLEATNQRTFGLFHYADRTEARVRNVVWRGAWPRELPALDDQELAVDETGFLDAEVPELTATFSHDFAADGLPVTRFATIRGDHGAHILPTSEGLRAMRRGTGGYRNATVAPIVTIQGDFDITASFDAFLPQPGGEGTNSTIWLGVVTDDGNEALLLRRHTLLHGDQQLVQCVRNRKVDGEMRRNYFAHLPVEATSGTLRLARRGDRIYYLFAETDSEQFRIMGHESFPTGELSLEGVRLAAQIFGDSGSTSVVWKQLTIRAESLSGLATESSSELLAELNQQRDNFPESFSHDFSKEPPSEHLFHHWPDEPSWNSEDAGDSKNKGLLMVHPGTDAWSSSGMGLLKQIEGDFDIAVTFDVGQLADPAEGKHSAIYLQLQLADPGRTQISAMINKRSEQSVAVAQLRVPDGQDDYHYRNIGGVNVSSAESLRIARRGKRIYYLATSRDFDGERIIAHTDAGESPILPFDTRFLLHTGGEGRESRVVWKEIKVHANKVQQLEPAPAADPPQKGLLDSILDLFK